MKNNPDYIQYRKELEQELDKKTQIVELLNTYGSCSIGDYSPLDINFINPDILFEIITNRLEYIRETIEFIDKRTNLGVFVYFAFKALFIGINELKFAGNFLERKNYFKTILQCYMDHKITGEMMKLTYKLGEKIGKKEKELFPLSIGNIFVYFIYVLLRLNQSTIAELNIYLMRMLEKTCIVDFHFEDNDLKNIPHEQIINNLFDIFFVDKINNNFHLYIKEGVLKAVPFTIEELNEYINSPDIPNVTKINEVKNAKKKKKKKKKNKKSKALEKESQKIGYEDKKEEIKSQDNTNNENKEEIKNIEIPSNDKKDEKDIQNINSKKIEEKGEQYKIVIQEIERLKESNKANEKRINELEKYKKENENRIKELEIYNEENEEKIENLEEYKEESEKLIEDLQKYKEETTLNIKKKDREIKKLNIHNEKQNKLIISLQKKCRENAEEIFNIKSDIKLIKLRRAFKVFVNYIYNGLNLQGDLYYEDKIEKIIEFLDNLTSDEYDKELVNSTKAFMNELYDKIDLGNNAAHHIDLSISVLDQLFEFIDKQKKHEDFKNRLKFGSNAETDIKDLIINIEYKYKRNKGKDTKVIVKNVMIPDLCKLWMKI